MTLANNTVAVRGYGLSVEFDSQHFVADVRKAKLNYLGHSHMMLHATADTACVYFHSYDLQHSQVVLELDSTNGTQHQCLCGSAAGGYRPACTEALVPVT